MPKQLVVSRATAVRARQYKANLSQQVSVGQISETAVPQTISSICVKEVRTKSSLVVAPRRPSRGTTSVPEVSPLNNSFHSRIQARQTSSSTSKLSNRRQPLCRTPNRTISSRSTLHLSKMRVVMEVPQCLVSRRLMQSWQPQLSSLEQLPSSEWYPQLLRIPRANQPPNRSNSLGVDEALRMAADNKS